MIKKSKPEQNHVKIETIHFTEKVDGEEFIQETKHYGQNTIDQEAARINAEKIRLQNPNAEIVELDKQLADIADTQSVMDGEINNL